MKKSIVFILLALGLFFIKGCTPDNISEDETIEIQATGHGEVGDPDDNDEEEEVGG
ncbi:hypothetical protein [Kordia jejudonensis]|uniref:hypothetical protein n=1 Tax=Kordia jejudonensis TaxID=1348245 RepID=UPI0012E02F76|nr:hypothetical protein [Kordia jejudonensis]